MNHRFLAGSLAAVVCAVLFAGAGSARANEISACVSQSNGSVRIVGAASQCKGPDVFLQWNKDGSVGPNGKDGKDGHDGHDGKDGSAGISVTPLAPGNAHCPAGGIELTIASSEDHGDGDGGDDHGDGRGSGPRASSHPHRTDDNGCGDDKHGDSSSSWGRRLQSGLHSLRTSLFGGSTVKGNDEDGGDCGAPPPQIFFVCNGKDGKDGAAGAPGAQGPQGPQGPQGTQGPQGQQGPAGMNGAGVTVAVASIPDGPCGAVGGIVVINAIGVPFAVCNGQPGSPGTGGGGTPDADDTVYLTPPPPPPATPPTPIPLTSMTQVATLSPLPSGVWSIVAKATVSGGLTADCFLIPHSDSSPAADSSSALDETAVNSSVGPAVVVLTGWLDTTGSFNGADLYCSPGATAALAAVTPTNYSQSKIVAHQASELHFVGSSQ